MPSVATECVLRNRYHCQNAKKYCENMNISKRDVFLKEQVAAYFEG